MSERYDVRGYPTFLVLDSEGEVIDRWSGFGDPEEFIALLDAAVADPTTVAAKIVRYEAEPTVERAAVLGRILHSGGQSADAVEYFGAARSLTPDGGGEYAYDLFRATFAAARADEEAFPFDDVRRAADTVFSEDGVEPYQRLMTARIMAREALAREDPGMVSAYLEAGLEVPADDNDVAEMRRDLEILEALHVSGDAERAVALKRDSMPDGWTEDADMLNSFAWWCFENEVNLEEAERLARKGVELSEPGASKAMILDTVDEICNLRGDCNEALALIELAIAEDPDGEHYREQKTRFEDCA